MDLDLTDVDESTATAMTQQLLEQLQEAREEVEQAQRRVGGIRKMIDGLIEIFPAAEDVLPEDLDGDDEPRPRGTEAVRRVLDAQRGKWYAIPAIVSFLGQQGWLPESSNAANAVRTALQRAFEAGIVEKSRSTQGQVIYRVPAAKSPDDDEGEPF